jgi:hypothetical protein
MLLLLLLLLQLLLACLLLLLLLLPVLLLLLLLLLLLCAHSTSSHWCLLRLCTLSAQNHLQSYYSVGLLRSQGVEDTPALPPHVFAIADSAYRSMMTAEDYNTEGQAGASSHTRTHTSVCQCILQLLQPASTLLDHSLSCIQRYQT